MVLNKGVRFEQAGIDKSCIRNAVDLHHRHPELTYSFIFGWPQHTLLEHGVMKRICLEEQRYMRMEYKKAELEAQALKGWWAVNSIPP